MKKNVLTRLNVHMVVARLTERGILTIKKRGVTKERGNPRL
ncbi:MAG: hypothetical protein QW057_00775 [Candidatus Bathyarchaeia archaeon]